MTNRVRDDVNSTATTASKERQPGSVQIPDLDATQELVIAVLKTTREHWHSSVDPYSPLKAHVSVPTRYAAGKALRNKVPRESHAEWNPPKNRPPAVDLVMAGNAGRQPELVPLRIGRMAASPSAFLRGAAAVMAWDLSHTPITGIQTLIDGDAHINNFGLYFWGFVCGTLLAHAHCRNGDAAKMAGYCGKSEVLDETLADFAEAYGDQTETDHAALVQAVQQGRVKAVEGV
jgi:hypothetical protein